jgi:hypothetical protein
LLFQLIFVKVLTYCVLKPNYSYVFWYAVQIGIFLYVKERTIIIRLPKTGPDLKFYNML